MFSVGDIGKFIPFPFARSGKRELVGIDVSAAAVRLAHVKTNAGRREIAGLKYRDITGLPEPEVVKAVRALYDELGAEDPAVIYVVPAQSVITKNIEVPSTDAREIREIISLQAGRHTPYSREEIAADYIDIGVFKHSYTKILLIIAERKAVKKQCDIVEKAGLRIDRVLLAPESFAWSVPRMLKMDTHSAPAGIVNIDENNTDFTAVFRNKVLFIRSIPIGAKQITQDRDKYALKFAEELRKSFEAYQNEDIERIPASLIVTGAVEGLGDLAMSVQNALPVPLQILPYARNLPASAQVLQAAAGFGNKSFLNVAASLLALGETKVDLLPEEIRMRKKLEESGRDLVATGILALTLFVLVFFILAAKIYFKSLYLQTLNRKFASLDQEAEKLEKDFSSAAVIKNYLSSRGYALEVLAELHATAPSNLKCEYIRYDQEQNKFSLRGTAESMSAVFVFVDTLEKSKYFKDVKIKYTTKRKDGMADFTDFEIIAAMEKGEKRV